MGSMPRVSCTVVEVVEEWIGLEAKCELSYTVPVDDKQRYTPTGMTIYETTRSPLALFDLACMTRDSRMACTGPTKDVGSRNHLLNFLYFGADSSEKL